MKPGPLTYVRARSVEEAVDRLAEGGFDAKIIAGGQSLMPMLNLRMVAAETLVDVRSIPGMASVEEDAGAVRYGACVTHARIQRGAVPDPSRGLMPAVAARIAYQAVRNRGTIGGSLALADPSADWITTTAALGATVEWQGPAGAGSCPADAFVQAAYTTCLDTADLLTGIRIPRLEADARWGTYKLCRKTGEFAHAMAMVVAKPRGSRAFLGATDGAPIRLAHVAGVLDGRARWDDGLVPVLGEALAADLAESGRVLSDVYRWQSRTCLVRAVRMSFGIAPLQIEAA